MCKGTRKALLSRQDHISSQSTVSSKMHNITVLISENFSSPSLLAVSRIILFASAHGKRRFAPSFAVTRFRVSSTVVGRVHNTPVHNLLILEAHSVAAVCTIPKGLIDYSVRVRLEWRLDMCLFVYHAVFCDLKGLLAFIQQHMCVHIF